MTERTPLYPPRIAHDRSVRDIWMSVAILFFALIVAISALSRPPSFSFTIDGKIITNDRGLTSGKDCSRGRKFYLCNANVPKESSRTTGPSVEGSSSDQAGDFFKDFLKDFSKNGGGSKASEQQVKQLGEQAEKFAVQMRKAFTVR
ncbi:hypothetical protein CBER1_09083 [Cercospora berteroae]|uniref:Uncharacterized protein n=1 Tax=Cercospora berteroae TaxID=357750 RepID=A0A2S6C8X4_9PEZI|nr:hypothetical protein CBER1_09083 [Cercospora berteroae]